MSMTFPAGFFPRHRYRDSGVGYLDNGICWGDSTEWGQRNRLFALVEDTARFPPTRRLYGPDGQPISLRWPSDARRVLEVRLCGFNADRFLATMDAFEDLSEGTPSPFQRDRRRAMLIQQYENDATPSLHLYLADWEGVYDVRNSLFAPGQWLEIEMNPAAAGQPIANVFLDQPLAPGGENEPMSLTSISLIPLELEVRLRDIFSLAHVPDADFTERQEGDGPANPNTPSGPTPTQQAPTPTLSLVSSTRADDRTGEASAS